ncbi:hypothetical protein [Butyrivibrio sp. INlla18]|uniref:hypothetical protein n=1 Tax=Butyrivibrio sp. INlla18 TaxID=1520806 RepID=UPI00115F9FEE|nr:hypothetical protein [Butyrivibrio sp. INlla18]
MEDLKNIYYSYATYCKDQSAELLITDEMLNKLDAIRKLLERADVQYLMESGYTEENEKIELARNQHPKWFKGGEIASDAVLYWALAPEIGAERVLGKKTFEEAAKTFGKNVAKGMALDVAIKDIPAATLSFASGQDIDTVLYNFGGALETDLVGNSIGEFVGIGFDAALSAVKSTIRESASETFESSCKTVQSAGNELEEIALEKNIDNIPTDNTEKIDIFAEKSGVGDASKNAKQGNSGDATQKIAYFDKAGSLLPAEGKIGSYKELIKQGKRGDNITPHHMPSCEYANKMGVSKNDGLCMNMEMYYPGKGGRHRLTYTYGNNMTNIQKQMYYELSPRDALTFDLKDIKRIYMQQGLYDDIRPQIREYIDESMRRWPNIYEK